MWNLKNKINKTEAESQIQTSDNQWEEDRRQDTGRELKDKHLRHTIDICWIDMQMNWSAVVLLTREKLKSTFRGLISWTVLDKGSLSFLSYSEKRNVGAEYMSCNIKQTARYTSSKHGFIWEHRKLQFGSLQPWATQKCTQSKGKRIFIEKEAGRVIANKQPVDFIGWVLARKEEKSLFLLVGSCLITGCESSPSGPLTLFNYDLRLLIFYISPFLPRSFY